MENMTYPVPISATVDRETGEITFEWIDDFDSFVRMGQIMNDIGRMEMETARTGETMH